MDLRVGLRIRQARREADLTQRELADRIGLKDLQSVSRYERGETGVPARRLRLIAEATGKPLEFFEEAPAWDEATVTGVLALLAELRAKVDEQAALLREVLDAQRKPPSGEWFQKAR